MLINKILVIDKGEVSKSIFEASYYSNYNFQKYSCSSTIGEFEIENSELIFVFVYEASDLLEVIPLYNRNSSLIIIYSDPTLSFDNLEYAYSINFLEGLEKTKKEIESIIDFITIQDVFRKKIII
jgi:GTPase SAR1 family protein